MIKFAKDIALQPIKDGLGFRVLVDRPEFLVEEIVCEAGMSTTSHAHDDDQVVVHVSGVVEVDLEGEKVTARSGCFYTIRAQAIHSIKCTESGTFLMVTPRKAHDDGHHH